MHRSGPTALVALSTLSRCLSTPESFYVLGAGASVPHVPTTDQLSERILGFFLKHGVFQTKPIARDVVASRVIRDPEYWKDPLKWELIQSLPPNYAIGKLPELLTTQASMVSANYDVFALAAKPSTIFNMNVDRLATRSCRGHRVFEPHGRSLSPEMFERIGWGAYTKAILDFPELSPPTIPGLVLPGPEPAEILTRAEYRAAARLLPMSMLAPRSQGLRCSESTTRLPVASSKAPDSGSSSTRDLARAIETSEQYGCGRFQGLRRLPQSGPARTARSAIRKPLRTRRSWPKARIPVASRCSPLVPSVLRLWDASPRHSWWPNWCATKPKVRFMGT